MNKPNSAISSNIRHTNTKKISIYWGLIIIFAMLRKWSIEIIKSKWMSSTLRNHYSIGIGIFWTVASIIGAFLFSAGVYLGTAKFDKDKNELVDQNRELKLELENIKGSSRIIHDTIIVYKSQLIEKTKNSQEIKADVKSYDQRGGQTANQIVNN